MACIIGHNNLKHLPNFVNQRGLRCTEKVCNSCFVLIVGDGGAEFFEINNEKAKNTPTFLLVQETREVTMLNSPSSILLASG